MVENKEVKKPVKRKRKGRKLKKKDDYTRKIIKKLLY